MHGVQAPKGSLRLRLPGLSQVLYSALGFTAGMTSNGGDMKVADGAPAFVHGETDTDHEPTTQQRIYLAVLRGDMDDALALTREHHPNVLDKQDGLLLFKLRCRKLGEIIVQAAGTLRGPQLASASADTLQGVLAYGRILRAECGPNPAYRIPGGRQEVMPDRLAEYDTVHVVIFERYRERQTNKRTLTPHTSSSQEAEAGERIVLGPGRAKDDGVLEREGPPERGSAVRRDAGTGEAGAAGALAVATIEAQPPVRGATGAIGLALGVAIETGVGRVGAWRLTRRPSAGAAGGAGPAA